MPIESVTVGSRTYNIAQASAVNQKKLMSIVASRMVYNLAGDADTPLDINFLVGALIGSPEADFDKIADIVLYKTVENGGDTLVTIEDFQGRITEYYQLVAEAVKVNLEDFIDWLNLARQPNAETVANTKAM